MSYQPPYTITPAILTCVAQISEALGRLAVIAEMQNVRLRRINRIRTLHGSLAIEGNTLSEDQISTILDGKTVMAPPREVQEVRNAIKAYDEYPHWHPANETDLLAAHQIMCAGLLDTPGQYRTGAVGVMGSTGVIHIAPPAKRIPELMGDLLGWLRTTDEHPLIRSCVFHYEFEFIHPFEDGNGRMGRLWQTLILTRWNPLFANIPIESMVYARQSDYYKAIGQSSKDGQSTPFIGFMLNAILQTIEKNAPVNAPVNVPVNVRKMKTREAILVLVSQNAHITRNEMAQKIGKDVRTIARAIKKLQEQGWLRRVGSDKTGHWERIYG